MQAHAILKPHVPPAHARRHRAANGAAPSARRAGWRVISGYHAQDPVNAYNHTWYPPAALANRALKYDEAVALLEKHVTPA